MLAPIYEQNAKGRYVYLPEDMLLWKPDNYLSKNYLVVKKGHRYIDVDLKEIPIFIRKNKMIVKTEAALNVEKIEDKQLNIIAFVEDKAKYLYYDDDGKTYDFKKGRFSTIAIEIEKVEDDFKISVENKGNRLVKKINFEIIDIEGKVYTKTISLEK